jgi:hypothetical protein
MSISTRREGKRSRLIGDYPKFMKVALAAVCTTSALTLNCGTSAMILSRASCRSMIKNRSLLSSMKMMTNSNKGRDQRKKRNVLALDFDGVVCASSVESSFSSIVAAEKFWPGVCKIMVSNSEIDEIDSSSTISSYSSISTEGKNSRFCRIRAAVNELRPIVETGFENMLLVRALNEELQSTG